MNKQAKTVKRLSRTIKVLPTRIHKKKKKRKAKKKDVDEVLEEEGW